MSLHLVEGSLTFLILPSLPIPVGLIIPEQEALRRLGQKPEDRKTFIVVSSTASHLHPVLFYESYLGHKCIDF